MSDTNDLGPDDEIRGDEIRGDDAKDTADHLFVDAALRHIHAKDVGPDAREGKIRRVLDAIDAPLSPIRNLPTREKPASHITAALAAAASLLLGFLIWSALTPTPLTAYAAVARAADAMRSGADRHYQIVRSVDIDAEDVTPVADATELYIRGPDLFALRSRGPVGFFWIGHDGDEYWAVPALSAAPVFVGANMSSLDSFLSASSPEQAFLTVNAVLNRMSESYDLTLSASDDHGEFEVRGVRQDPVSVYPDRVALRADAKSGVVRSLKLFWENDAADLGPSSVTFRLLDETPQPDELYRHDSHHEADRAVRRF